MMMRGMVMMAFMGGVRVEGINNGQCACHEDDHDDNHEYIHGVSHDDNFLSGLAGEYGEKPP